MSDLIDNHKYEDVDYGDLEKTYKFIFDINDLDKLFGDLTDVYEKLDGYLGRKPSIEIYYTKDRDGIKKTYPMGFIPGTTVLSIDKIINHFKRQMAYPLIDLNAYDVVNSKIDVTNAHLNGVEFIMKLVIR